MGSWILLQCLLIDEERIHAGEFLKLLYHLAPDEEEFYREGFEEVEEEFEDLL